MRTLLVALILALALPAHAAITTTRKPVGLTEILEVRNTLSTNKFNLIEGAATNGSPSVTIPLDRAWIKLRVLVFSTYVANTYVSLTMQCSLDGTNFAKTQTRTLASGASTLNDLTDTKTLGAADQDFGVEFDVYGCQSVKLTLGGDNTDVADLQAVAGR